MNITILATSEYHGSVSGTMTKALDWLDSKELKEYCSGQKKRHTRLDESRLVDCMPIEVIIERDLGFQELQNELENVVLNIRDKGVGSTSLSRLLILKAEC